MKGLWAPPVALSTPASKPGVKGRLRGGAGPPARSRVEHEVLGRGLFGSAESQGVKVLSTGYVPHWVGVASSPRSEPKKCRLNS